jgi:hypothetical protein
MFNCSVPRMGIKAEPRVSLPIIRHRGQLEKVTGNNKLDSTKRAPVVLQDPCNLFQLVKEIAVDHGHLVDDKHLRAHPPMFGFLVTSYLLDKLRNFLLAKSNASEAMKRDATDVARCETRGCGDGDTVGFSGKLLS